MPHDIKALKPKKDSRYKQGYVNPGSCKKLFEECKNSPIIYRSSYEEKFIKWCESCKNVKKWGSECFSIKYINALDGEVHNYYPDFLVEMVDGTKVIVEIKPYAQTQKPVRGNQKEIETYVKNMCKWNAAKKLCDDHTKFWIITEHTIDKLK